MFLGVKAQASPVSTVRQDALLSATALAPRVQNMLPATSSLQVRTQLNGFLYKACLGYGVSSQQYNSD